MKLASKSGVPDKTRTWRKSASAVDEVRGVSLPLNVAAPPGPVMFTDTLEVLSLAPVHQPR